MYIPAQVACLQNEGALHVQLLKMQLKSTYENSHKTYVHIYTIPAFTPYRRDVRINVQTPKTRTSFGGKNNTKVTKPHINACTHVRICTYICKTFMYVQSNANNRLFCENQARSCALMCGWFAHAHGLHMRAYVLPNVCMKPAKPSWTLEPANPSCTVTSHSAASRFLISQLALRCPA
jgi:hypothetical protein